MTADFHDSVAFHGRTAVAPMKQSSVEIKGTRIARLRILSRLPKQFEEVALEKKENREAARHRLMADLEISALDAEEASLDIDEVADDILEMPKVPEPSLNPIDLDLALNHPGVLPPGTEWRRLDLGTYALRLPGMAQEIRVTTSAEVFDDHFESHEFLSPGGPLFERIASISQPGTEERPEDSLGKVCVIRNSVTGVCRVIVRRIETVVTCESLTRLIEAIDENDNPGPLPDSFLEPDESVHWIA